MSNVFLVNAVSNPRDKTIKDIAKEIKIIKSASTDKAQDYTVRRAIERIEQIIENEKAGGVKALALQGGIDAIINANSRRPIPTYGRNNEMRQLADAARGILHHVADENVDLILEESCFSLLLNNVANQQKKVPGFPL